MKDIAVILPVLNEENTIEKVIDEALEKGWKVLVVDSGSIDNTLKLLKSKKNSSTENFNFKVVHKKGKGYAVKSIIENLDTEWVIMMDTDYTYLIDDAQRALEFLTDYDVVLGYRKYKDKGSMRLLLTLGNGLLSLLASLLYNFRVYDLCSGLWAFRVAKLREFNLKSNGFTLEADLFINSIKTGCSIKQIPISYRAREFRSKSKLKISDGFKIGWFLIKERFCKT